MESNIGVSLTEVTDLLQRKKADLEQQLDSVDRDSRDGYDLRRAIQDMDDLLVAVSLACRPGQRAPRSLD